MTDDCAIRKLQQDWLNATMKGDLAVICALMTDDVVFLTPGKPSFGRQEFIESFNALREHVTMKCYGEYEEIVVVGDFAYARARLEITVTNKNDGMPKHFEGNTLSIFSRSTDGEWRLCRDANLLVPKVS